LFGHVKGSFTGATGNKRGIFEQAGEGTVFLDEISETSAGLQVKLLRVLQEREVVPVGGADVIKVRARVIAASNSDLEKLSAGGAFRRDLLYRLNVIQVHLPPLRERRDDIPLLVAHFLLKHSLHGESPVTIDEEAMRALSEHSWPGKVRELENVTRRLLLSARGLAINADAVRQTLAARNPETAPTGRSFAALAGDLLARAQKGELQDAHARMLADAEREILTQAITLAEGNQAKAARWLGLSRFTLREKLKQLGLHPDSSDASAETNV